MRTVVQSTRVVLADGVRPAAILIEDGKIISIGDHVAGRAADAARRVTGGSRADGADDGARHSGRAAPDTSFADYGELVISPGVVDTHVHVNEPGRTEWEGFDTATRAAAAGGVTTIVDMPLNSIPATTTAAALASKRACAEGRLHVDVAFWGGIVPGNAGEVEPLVDAGVRGFKCFLVPSGVDEFPAVGERELREVLPMLARRNVPLLVHAEDPSYIRALDATHPSYALFLASRPVEAEIAAVEMMVRLAREFGARVHIVHVACAEAADVIARAKDAGVPVTAETCPHYLTFAAEEIPPGGTEFKCAPPIREARHRAALRDAIRAGILDLIASDHSPAPPAMKCAGDFARAWGGVASIELSLAAAWTALGPDEPSRAAEDATLRRLAHCTSAAPAALAGLHAKGRIAPGADADLTIWDPAAETTVDRMKLRQRHKLTPYDGRRLRGRVAVSYVRGACVWREDAPAAARRGRLL